MRLSSLLTFGVALLCCSSPAKAASVRTHDHGQLMVKDALQTDETTGSIPTYFFFSSATYGTTTGVFLCVFVLVYMLMCVAVCSGVASRFLYLLCARDTRRRTC